MELVFSQLLDGLSIGSVLLLAATGLAIVFGLMGVINLAHGELMMIGAYVTFVVQNLFKPLPEGLFQLYYPVALVAAFFVTALVGVLLEKTLIRQLYGRPLETLLATWGVSLILIQFVRSVSTAMMLGILLTAAIGIFANRFLRERIQSLSFAPYVRGLIWTGAAVLGWSAFQPCPMQGFVPSSPPGLAPAILTLLL